MDIHHLLSCTELRNVTICPTPLAAGWGAHDRQFWQAVASLGWQHGGRLQLLAGPGNSQMLEAEPSLAALVSQAWGADAVSGWADQVSSLSSLTMLALNKRRSALGDAGMLDALRQLSALQSLHCPGDVMQTLLVKAVPRSWSLLTELQLTPFSGAPDLSLVEQQCPQLQALATQEAVPLSLAALTSLTCQYWLPQQTASFQCSRLGHLHVVRRAEPSVLPSTLTSLSLNYNVAWPCLYEERVRSQQSLVHICFTSLLVNLSAVRGLVPTIHAILAVSVTSLKLNVHPQAFIQPDMDGQHLQHLGALFPRLQRVHIHLHGSQQEGPPGKVLISAAWLPAHCRLVVTHKLTCPVRVVKCPPGCLSLPLSSCPADDM